MPNVPMPDGEDIEIAGDRVRLGIRRCPDGSAVFAMTEGKEDALAYAICATPAAVMALIEFLLNQPVEGAKN